MLHLFTLAFRCVGFCLSLLPAVLFGGQLYAFPIIADLNSKLCWPLRGFLRSVAPQTRKLFVLSLVLLCSSLVRACFYVGRFCSAPSLRGPYAALTTFGAAPGIWGSAPNPAKGPQALWTPHNYALRLSFACGWLLASPPCLRRLPLRALLA